MSSIAICLASLPGSSVGPNFQAVTALCQSVDVNYKKGGDIYICNKSPTLPSTSLATNTCMRRSNVTLPGGMLLVI